MYDDVAGHLDHLEGRLQLLTNYLIQQDPNLEEIINPPAPEPVPEPVSEPVEEKPEEMQVDATEDDKQAEPVAVAEGEQ